MRARLVHEVDVLDSGVQQEEQGLAVYHGGMRVFDLIGGVAGMVTGTISIEIKHRRVRLQSISQEFEYWLSRCNIRVK